MSLPTLRRLVGTCAVAAGALATTLAPTSAGAVGAPAGGYSDLVIFGDSLSDTGNLSIATGGARPGNSQPYFDGRFSNGLIWTDLLATGLGQAGDAAPFLAGGNNYAFAGARTNNATFGTTADSVPGLLYQTQTYWGGTHAAADPNALYVLVGGGNDLRDGRIMAPGNSLLETSFRQLSADAAVANLKSSLGLLAARGAEHVLISNMPDLGNTPEAAFLGVQAASSDITDRFNAQMPSLMSYGASLGLTMSFLDMAGVAQAVREDTLFNNSLTYGVLDIWAPCQGFAGSAGTPCSLAAFSDGLHPSARVHELFAGAAFNALGVTPVPEPQTVVLMLAGLAMLGRLVRRRSQAA